MAIKKSELYSSLWASCDELRGGMDASQYKDYVLVLLFVKYVSDKYAGQKNALIDVPVGGRFVDMVALKGDKEIGDKINKIIGKLAEANDLKGVIDVADFNDEDKLGKGQDMVDRLSNLISIFNNPNLNFSSNRAEGDDILGDAYEYLMRHFATQSGKSKGQFYTPAEVSRIMAKVIGISGAKTSSQTIYDPTCGSGSLLLKAADESKAGVTIYGQENDNATAALAKMNMILHGSPTAEIWKDNSLSAPHFLEKNGSLKLHDFAVANPPFSTKAWSNGLDPTNDLYSRFADGIPPAKNGDYAFLLHLLRSLKSTGKGAIILPHGVLFRGGAEGVIRKNILNRGYIKGIIGLPANLFYGTGIPACIIVLDKENAAARKGIFMMDASRGFVKDGNKNRLRHQDIHKIVDVFNKQLETPKYARMVPMAEIESNDYNLNIPRYIDSSEAEDLQDIEAHLMGGIPNADIDALKNYWHVLPTIQKQLFKKSARVGYSEIRVAPSVIKQTIFSHPEFITYTNTVKSLFAQWQAAHIKPLKNIKVGDHPKQLIEILSESLLHTFESVALIDQYDVYQHLMSYWSDIMQDDVYMLVSDGWQAQTDGKPNTDLIPMDLIIDRYFSKEHSFIETLEAGRDDIKCQMQELDEEHGGEEGLLVEAKNDKGKLTKATVAARIKDIQTDADAVDEFKMLGAYAALIESETLANKKIKDAQKILDAKVDAQYAKLSEADIKTLVVEDKWLATLSTDIQTELDRVSQALTARIKQLAERYATPLPLLTQEVNALSEKVDAHLKKMGFVWE
jgi:type I restriction enzyme M protein